MHGEDGQLQAELRSLVSEGRWLEAINLYCERTGAGLDEATEVVDALEVARPPVVGASAQGPSTQATPGSRTPSQEAPSDPSRDREIIGFLQQGQKIPAIKRYRELTGAGLKEAKEAVEAMEAGETPPIERPDDGSWEAEVVSLLRQGQKIPAIKIYRERTGVGLKEAKEAVEAIATEQDIPRAAGAGCGGAVLLGLVMLLSALLTHMG